MIVVENREPERVRCNKSSAYWCGCINPARQQIIAVSPLQHAATKSLAMCRRLFAFGEDIFQCAQRCAQETGLQISQLSSGPVTNNIFTGQHLHTVTLYVMASKCEGVENAGWQWFDWQHLPQPLFLPMQLLATQHKNWLRNVMNNVIN